MNVIILLIVCDYRISLLKIILNDDAKGKIYYLKPGVIIQFVIVQYYSVISLHLLYFFHFTNIYCAVSFDYLRSFYNFYILLSKQFKNIQ